MNNPGVLWPDFLIFFHMFVDSLFRINISSLANTRGLLAAYRKT